MTINLTFSYLFLHRIFLHDYRFAKLIQLMNSVICHFIAKNLSKFLNFCIVSLLSNDLTNKDKLNVFFEFIVYRILLCLKFGRIHKVLLLFLLFFIFCKWLKILITLINLINFAYESLPFIIGPLSLRIDKSLNQFINNMLLQ